VLDVGGLQDERGFRVFHQREQQVLEGYGAVRLLAGEPMRPFQALAQIGRHGYRLQLVRKWLRHRSLRNGAHGAANAPAPPTWAASS
jgi:hypothetical protein